ncbi:class I SAM-dependent methyltransferase [Helicobacter sp. 23-1048]
MKLDATKNEIDNYAVDYIEHDKEDSVRRFRQKKVIEILNHHKPKNILEIGCGCWSFSELYHDYDKFFIVERSERFCKIIRESKHYNSKINVLEGFLEENINTLKNEKFDFILLSGVLHEVPNQIELLNAIKSLCNKDTILHINVPNNKSFHLLWAYESGLIQQIGDLTDTATHFKRHSTFDLKSLSSFVNSCGFKVLDTAGGGGFILYEAI